jgi:nitrous oxide reductase accessory protein NosL
VSHFLGMEILTGIVDGKLRFCVIEEAASGASSEGKHVPFETLEQAKAYIKIKSGRVVTVKDDG